MRHLIPVRLFSIVGHSDTLTVVPSVLADVMDAILDYPSWFPLIQAFASTNGKMSLLANTMTAAQQNYKNGLFGTGSFIENHDQPRFQSFTKDDAVRTLHACL